MAKGFLMTLSMNIIVWNIRGVKKKKSRGYLRRLIRERNVAVVALMETKAVGFSRQDANWLLGGGWDFEAHPSEGLSVGFLILWRKDVDLIVTGASSHTMACTIKTSHDGRMTCYFVYGPKCHHRRRIIWEDVRNSCGGNEPLLVAGDFNLILAPEEKRGSGAFMARTKAGLLRILSWSFNLWIWGFPQ
ncbi:hypothetical protein HPP92_026386 [Vanilla planifolia]|uniref:Endonuclease/exonuclease/phosphatase domain-containing protein n=1 Tax=Vanilla planifolia TaxID=51239 RepID=A0A835PGP3_VANPL|nr:hypothetical protein HPP92_026386 [Vanilla planifolia]